MNRENIIERASELFLSKGCKLVTMDMVALETGTSKRTLYELFEDKSKLVEACVIHLYRKQDELVKKYFYVSENVLELLLTIHKSESEEATFTMDNFIFDIKKYYYNVFSTTVVRLLEDNKNKLIQLIELGQQQQVFRKEIDSTLTALVIISLIMSIKNPEGFIKNKNYSSRQLINITLFTYLRGMSTAKGLKILDNFFDNQ